ncbi:MAG: NADH-quinone oxidoreductase subunit L, partial [Aquificaceae bacterium]|nr:NADH-quinone oxidoreductase subunit L [Aquificaceae bacterium]
VLGVKKELHLEIAVLSTFVALSGIGVAYLAYVRGFVDPHRVYESLKPLHTTFREQFFTERLYHNVLAGGYLFYSKILYMTAERQLIDGLVNLTYPAVRSTGSLFRTLQRGKLNFYVLSLSFSFLLLLALTLLWR